jgi:hypothetical protein
MVDGVAAGLGEAPTPDPVDVQVDQDPSGVGQRIVPTYSTPVRIGARQRRLRQILGEMVVAGDQVRRPPQSRPG